MKKEAYEGERIQFQKKTETFLQLVKDYSPNLLRFVMEFFRMQGGKQCFYGKSSPKTDYIGYHDYLLNNIVNRNIDIWPIRHIAKRKIMITTINNNLLLFHLTYI